MIWISRLSLFLFFLLALFVLGPVAYKGLGSLNWNYLTSDPSLMGREGGIAPMLYTTLVMNIFGLFVTIVLGLPSAYYLYQARFRVKTSAKILNVSLDLLAGTPSIVFGLFGHAFFNRYLGLGYSLLSGALTLSLMMLPFFTRLCEDAFAEIPEEYRHLSNSLQLSEAARVFHILLPMIWPALTAAILLAWTRALGETAALLFTSGYSMKWPESVLDSGRALSVHIFDLSLNISGADDMAYRAAMTLLMMTVLFVVLCRLFMKGFLRWKMRLRY